MNKKLLESKTVKGLIVATITAILNIYFPHESLVSLMIAGLGYAGYGIRDAMK